MKTCFAVLTVLLCGALAAAEAEPGQAPEAPPPKVDAEKIKALVAKLASEEYADREQAVKELSNMPSEAFSNIEEEGKKYTADPEVASRIGEVRENMGLKVLKTKDEVLAYLHKQVAAAAHDGRIGKAQSVLEEGLEKLKELTPKKEWNITVARVYQDAGMIYYKAGHSDTIDRKLLREAEKMLDKAVDAYDEALKYEPNNQALQNAQVECNMILYAARKYLTL